MSTNNVIYCIGDSHASFFSGNDKIQPVWPDLSHDSIPAFKSFRLGPVTAYNLCKINSSTKGREKLFSVLDTLLCPSNILLCFGEIDCRVHLLKQSRLQNRSIDDVVKECVERYLSVANEIRNLGHRVIVWAPIASTENGNIAEPEYQAFGTCEERNQLTRVFNLYLEKKTKLNNIGFLSIFESLLDKNDRTRFYYYSDQVHLSQRAMPKVIRKLKSNFREINIVIFNNFLNNLNFDLQIVLFTIVSYFRAFVNNIYRMHIMFKEQIVKIINSNKFLAKQKIILDWYRHNKPTPPPHAIKEKIVKKFAKKYGINTFIESGTYLGDMVMSVKNIFRKIYSIELSHELATAAKKRFSDYNNIKILQGDSGQVLPVLLAEINEAVLFWLDGHYSSGVTAKGDLFTPIFKELEAILNHKIKNHVILIDDARLFVGEQDYPTVAQLSEFVIKISPASVLNVINDIIVIENKI